jgi:arginyl-tRNA synthetase
MKDKILKILNKAIKSLNLEKILIQDFEINTPPQKEFGHYSTNIAFKLTKILKKEPKLIALELKEKILNCAPKDFFQKIEIAEPGFLNFWISQKAILKEINKVFTSGQPKIKRSQKPIIFEYSDPNIAKKMHVGHLRGTIIGDALANIYEFLGYKVIRWNYLGDWGTQFGHLISAYKLWGKKSEIKKDPINTMLKLYVRFHKEMKLKPELKKLGQEEFKKLESGDKENRALWSWFKKESLIEFKKIYKLLDVRFDIWIGESFYEKDVPLVIKKLIKKGIVQKSEGALIVPLDQFNLPPALILKSDEASLYLTRDIANLIYRVKKFKPLKIIYIVGNEQSLHFNQLFAIAQLLGFDPQKFLHIKYGLVLGENKKKLKTREGEFVTLEEVLEKAIKLAYKIVSKNKNLSSKEKEKIAQIVGIGALKYNDLKEHRHNDIVFNWSKMLDLKGQSAPYIQYTYIRLKSILKKSKNKDLNQNKLMFLENEFEKDLALKILEFWDVLNLSAQNYLTSYLANYLYELAFLVNRFYENVPVLKEKNEKIKASRIVLIKNTAEILKQGLNLLGIKTPSKM